MVLVIDTLRIKRVSGSFFSCTLHAVYRLVEISEDLVAPKSMLNFSLINSVSSMILTRCNNVGLLSDFLNLVVLGFIFADFRRIGLTSMALGPTFATCSIEARRFLTTMTWLLS